MTRLARKFTLLVILLYPLDGFKLAVTPGLSLYRIALILALIFGLLDCLSKRKLTIPQKTVFPFIIVAGTSSVLSNFISTEPDYAISAMLNELSGIIMIFLILTLFKYEDIDILLKQFVRSTCIGIPFAILSWFVLFQNPSSLESICSFGGFFKLDITDELVISCYNMRLSLPYSSSSVYSGVLAVTIVILLCDNSMYKGIFRNILIAIFSLMLIMTQARTGMLGLGIFIFFYLLRMRDNKRKSRMILLCIVAIIIIGLFVGSNEDFVRKFLSRFNNSGSVDVSILEDRHLLLPIEGLNIWLSGVKNFFIGIGYGSCINVKGLWTDIPYYFFNSYVTQLVAKGLLGLFIIAMWLKTKVQLGSLFKDRDSYSCRNKINAAFTVLLVCCLTYEFYPYYAFFIIVGIALLYINSQGNVKSSEKTIEHLCMKKDYEFE